MLLFRPGRQTRWNFRLRSEGPLGYPVDCRAAFYEHARKRRTFSGDEPRRSAGRFGEGCQESLRSSASPLKIGDPPFPVRWQRPCDSSAETSLSQKRFEKKSGGVDTLRFSELAELRGGRRRARANPRNATAQTLRDRYAPLYVRMLAARAARSAFRCTGRNARSQARSRSRRSTG